jgi:predicted GIY-YIG superfamily endonuclease
MGKPRNWYTYEFKRGNKVLHKGITKNLERREEEHQANLDPKGHIKQVGLPKTEDGARKWEEEQGCS